MATDMKIPAQMDKINVNDTGELLWWCAHLGIGPELLLFIVQKAGTSTQQVRSYLRNMKSK